MQDIRQSEMYARHMRRIGWVVEEIDGVKVFVKKFPVIGSFIKIQRPEKIPKLELIEEVVRKYRAWSVSIEPSQVVILGSEATPESKEILKQVQDDRKERFWTSQNDVRSNGFKVNNNPYLPTKTIQIDLTPTEDEIFNRFTEAKRRAVRRAVKNGVTIKESSDIEEFIKLKAKDFWPMGYFMAKDVRALWESFRPGNIAILLGYCHSERSEESLAHARSDIRQRSFVGTQDDRENKPVASILLLFYDNIAYYWMAASSEEGKKLFAPTLLVWEALKLAKKKGCRLFDFEGIYDQRFHKATKKWQGFTKFKEGFGGREILFPDPLIKKHSVF